MWISVRKIWIWVRPQGHCFFSWLFFSSCVGISSFLTESLKIVVAGDKNEEKEKEIKQEFGGTCDWIKKRLGDKVASVQISSRLSTSPCVLVSGKFGWSANMER